VDHKNLKMFVYELVI